MTQPKVTFYDIPHEQAFALAAKLAQAAWDKGKRLIVRCEDTHQAKALDDHLWTYRDESFVPHEVSDGALHDTRARIVLTTGDVAPIEPDILLQLAPAERAFAERFGHVIDLVDHRDDARLTASRQRYKAWTEAGTRPELKNKA